MKKRYKNSFRNKVLVEIDQFSESIILREDLKDLGSPRQVSRALKALVEDGELLKLGYGVYVKAEKSEYLNRPVIRTSFTEACIQVLERLGVKWELSQAHKDYNEGKSQQVPARFEVRLKSRFRRKIGYGDRSLRLEGDVYGK